MSRVFAYCRAAATSELVSSSQLRELAAAKGFAVDRDDVLVEVALLSAPNTARAGWRILLDRLYEGDALVVPKLDDLGRDVVEVRLTINLLATMGVKVHCLILGRMNLAGIEGKSAMDMLAAVASLDRCRDVEQMRNVESVRKPATPIKRGRPRSMSPEVLGCGFKRSADRATPRNKSSDHHATSRA